jgi:hypothetical protein
MNMRRIRELAFVHIASSPEPKAADVSKTNVCETKRKPFRSCSESDQITSLNRRTVRDQFDKLLEGLIPSPKTCVAKLTRLEYLDVLLLQLSFRDGGRLLLLGFTPFPHT